MIVLKYIICGIYIAVCLVMVTIILMQQGKEQGLGAIAGQQVETYWSKIKGRTREGVQKKITVVCAVLFFVLSIVIDMNIFH